MHLTLFVLIFVGVLKIHLEKFYWNDSNFQQNMHHTFKETNSFFFVSNTIDVANHLLYESKCYTFMQIHITHICHTWQQWIGCEESCYGCVSKQPNDKLISDYFGNSLLIAQLSIYWTANEKYIERIFLSMKWRKNYLSQINAILNWMCALFTLDISLGILYRNKKKAVKQRTTHNTHIHWIFKDLHARTHTRSEYT